VGVGLDRAAEQADGRVRDVDGQLGAVEKRRRRTGQLAWI
jgi:hypothetical protein